MPTIHYIVVWQLHEHYNVKNWLVFHYLEMEKLKVFPLLGRFLYWEFLFKFFYFSKKIVFGLSFEGIACVFQILDPYGIINFDILLLWHTHFAWHLCPHSVYIHWIVEYLFWKLSPSMAPLAHWTANGWRKQLWETNQRGRHFQNLWREGSMYIHVMCLCQRGAILLPLSHLSAIFLIAPFFSHFQPNV